MLYGTQFDMDEFMKMSIRAILGGAYMAPFEYLLLVILWVNLYRLQKL